MVKNSSSTCSGSIGLLTNASHHYPVSRTRARHERGRSAWTCSHARAWGPLVLMSLFPGRFFDKHSLAKYVGRNYINEGAVHARAPRDEAHRNEPPDRVYRTHHMVGARPWRRCRLSVGLRAARFFFARHLLCGRHHQAVWSARPDSALWRTNAAAGLANNRRHTAANAQRQLRSTRGRRKTAVEQRFARLCPS